MHCNVKGSLCMEVEVEVDGKVGSTSPRKAKFQTVCIDSVPNK